MWEDPIVAEVHRAREKLAAECNFDIKAFFAGLRQRQVLLGDRLVSPKKTAEADQRLTAPPEAAPSEVVPSCPYQQIAKQTA